MLFKKEIKKAKEFVEKIKTLNKRINEKIRNGEINADKFTSSSDYTKTYNNEKMPKKRYTNKEIMDYLKRLESKIDQINNESIISKGFALVSIGVEISAIAIPIYIELIGITVKLGM